MEVDAIVREAGSGSAAVRAGVNGKSRAGARGDEAGRRETGEQCREETAVEQDCRPRREALGEDAPRLAPSSMLRETAGGRPERACASEPPPPLLLPLLPLVPMEPMVPLRVE